MWWRIFFLNSEIWVVYSAHFSNSIDAPNEATKNRARGNKLQLRVDREMRPWARPRRTSSAGRNSCCSWRTGRQGPRVPYVRSVGPWAGRPAGAPGISGQRAVAGPAAHGVRDHHHLHACLRFRAAGRPIEDDDHSARARVQCTAWLAQR